MHTPDPIIEIENIAKKADIKLIHYRDSVLHRFPLLFSFLAIFSTASILYGFELIISRIQFFQNYPVILILGGIGVLFFTGMLYKSLGKV
ncbi:MAG: hypothetical protein UR60_C0022G0008 [Candidatus Moranbacteria bacterium GW2011_GWF2_34_56]|nr:MAG: hypothetical protein UR51_C0018G0009 [Candidatus Moranbacteria bacterium GW2011_GWF1_34_10]KKP64378.1 MAG: hypothetical protein UR60_C0022G0008 [Candidatus Moranbacteria bacterium GW2011_GWF2_34_56]HBI16970.1 hypothetical protein [Candidatus Moranbacteria bacterium]